MHLNYSIECSIITLDKISICKPNVGMHVELQTQKLSLCAASEKLRKRAGYLAQSAAWHLSIFCMRTVCAAAFLIQYVAYHQTGHNCNEVLTNISGTKIKPHTHPWRKNTSPPQAIQRSELTLTSKHGYFSISQSCMYAEPRGDIDQTAQTSPTKHDPVYIICKSKIKSRLHHMQCKAIPSGKHPSYGDPLHIRVLNSLF